MGRLRSGKPEEPPPALLDPCRADIGRRARPTVLVDLSPDLRDQLLEAGTKHIDGILVTHSHADHTHGIDDVRPLVIKMRRRVDLYMDEPTEAALRARFGYVFETPPAASIRH